ncbi:hypothetical protein SAMN05444159_2073 [Bradyrhizobium lablabi]|uniref:HTH cro/C1-type domain-containing protein n=1 Tax=Bradyrhizobium lablabi TaxID=722472 RepID=A0A1M6NQN7_9BRAD|nr:hypothetical protein SAMN05444159_2073 [Bradyrhizobium lablabi]
MQSSRHQALKDFLVEKRKKAGMTQAEVAKKLRRYQSFVATVEGGHWPSLVAQSPLPLVRSLLLDLGRSSGS